MSGAILVEWLHRSAERLADAAPTLTALDQAIGDGDHGTNMNRGFAAVVAKLDSDAADLEPADALRLVGRTLISTVGGAAGPLYGTAFLRASAALADRPVDAAAALDAFDAAVGGIAALGKSTTGEKTMLDALVPAGQAARAAHEAGASARGVVVAAADAAASGAEATIPMLATKGRASYLGERSIGHKDPGATSSALLLAVAAEVAGTEAG
jgi:dihydroxyacetone kinase-like protein